MITATNLIAVRLQPFHLRLAEAEAQACALGGTSQVRASDRQVMLYEDQVVGQLGTVALHRYWFGHLELYLLGRYFQNKNPWQGDQGEDIPGANIDVKTSLMRRSLDPLTYNLPVRARERHPDWVYVLALLPPDYQESRMAWLVGWISDAELPSTPKADGPLAGAFVVPATDLHPLPPFHINLLPNDPRRNGPSAE